LRRGVAFKPPPDLGPVFFPGGLAAFASFHGPFRGQPRRGLIGLLAGLYGLLEQGGVDLKNGMWLGLATVVLSNIVSNVPAVMLLLPADSSQRSP
jgi:hypothetical protein